jgi:hypothetical protein
MIIHSGKGFLSVVFLALGIWVSQEGIEAVTGQKPAQQNADLMWAMSFGIGAAGNFVLARRLSRTPTRTVIDKATGKEFELTESSSLFFIPTRWWTPIFGAVALFRMTAFLWPTLF